MINNKQFQEKYSKSIRDPEKFWAEIAETTVDWFQKWNKVFEWKFPNYKWFIGGKLNVTYNCLDRHIKAGLGKKIALIYLNENNERITISYENLLKKVNKFSNGLKSLDVKRGDRVIIYMPLVIEQIIAMLACARIGAIHSVVFAGFSSHALHERIEDLKAKIIITATYIERRGEKKLLIPTVEEAIKDSNFIEAVVVLNRNKNKNTLTKQKEVDFYDLLDKQNDICEPEMMNSEDPLFILYTSGSTGKPKGVVHTNGGFLVYAHYTLKTVFDIKMDDIYWCTADPGWITGHSYITYGPLSNGLTTVIVEGVPDYPKPDNWYKIIEQEKINIFYTSPTAIRMLRKYGEKYCQQHDLSSLRVLGTVGEPINPEVWNWYYEFIGNKKCPIVDTWWQTETGGHMIVTLPGMPEKAGVAGLPFYGIDAIVVNQEGKEISIGEKGFLVIKKPWPGALSNCWNNFDRFAQYWNKNTKMFITGDFAIKDKNDYIQILGRSDDVINVSGHRVGTAEVENVIVSFAGVAEAAIIGKPDDIKGEKLKAFIVLKSGITGDDNFIFKIKKFIKTEIAAFSVPDEIEFVQSLPKTRSGKIMRRVLKAKELGQDVGDLTTLED